MTDQINLDALERLAKVHREIGDTITWQRYAAPTPSETLALIERVRAAEAERDEAVSKAMVWSKNCADANEQVERAEAQIHDDGGLIDQLVNMQERAERAEAMAAHDAEVATRAWGEGFRAGWDGGFRAGWGECHDRHREGKSE